MDPLKYTRGQTVETVDFSECPPMKVNIALKSYVVIYINLLEKGDKVTELYYAEISNLGSHLHCHYSQIGRNRLCLASITYTIFFIWV